MIARRPKREPEAMMDFVRELMKGLDKLGIQAGDEFKITKLGKSSATSSGLSPDGSSSENALGPFTRDSDTSRSAALDNYPKSGTQRWNVLVAIVHSGGLTRDELSERLDLPDSSVDGRVWELKKGEFVEESDGTRTTRNGSEAHVLIATRKGRREAEAHEGTEQGALI